jgi:hypothetical protein
MHPIFKSTGFLTVISLFAIATLISVADTCHAQHSGITPENSDGFETGDWRSFRPHYIGESDEFIRPNFSINDTNPIYGNYSLQWQGNDDEHEWVKVSNAFYLERPTEVSIDIRMNAVSDDWSAGLYLMETYDRYAGVRISPEENGLNVVLKDLTGATARVDSENGQILRLTVKQTGYDDVTAILSDAETGGILAELVGFSSVKPEALGIYVYTGAGSETVMDFDNILVESAPYRLKSGKWSRSPHFVVLPQLPDVAEDQGNWVGAQSTLKKDGEYLMWYRRRDNVDRGKGYGFARSSNGIDWEKYDGNPIFTYDDEQFSSAEKIHVLYVDGLYRAWYAVNAPGNWYTAYATSKDGKNWEKHGLVLDDTYTKDGDVIYHEGLYYLYAIKDNDNIGIFTSGNGIDWDHRNTIPMGVHRHVAATYVKRTGEFHVYGTGGFAGVSQAVSKDGIDFGPFKQVMDASQVGLDDWADAGVTYLSFLTDEHGKIKDDRQMPIYYQARNTWDNNIPGWLFHGSERVVLAGHYEGIFPGVKTTVLPGGGYEYHSFPFEIPRAEGIEIHASQKMEVHLKSWQPGEEILGEGSLTVPPVYRGHSGQVQTQVQWNLSNLDAGEYYELELDNQQVAREQADDQGRVLFTAITSGDSGDVLFRICRMMTD